MSDSLRIVAGAVRRPALFPQLFPIPDPVRYLVRQRESELMREHADLPAMVGFVRKHIARIPVAEQGGVRDLELGKAVERVRVVWRPRLRFVRNRSSGPAVRGWAAMSTSASA